jgi:Zn-dependent M28 family amino/carboxypeptidase
MDTIDDALVTRALGVFASLVACAALESPTIAQDTAEPSRSRAEIVEALVSEALARGQAYSKLTELCRVAPLRLSGSPGATVAVEWGRAQMERDGLENVRLEECLVPQWVRGTRSELSIVAPSESRALKLPVLALGGSVGTPPAGVEGDLVVVESFEELRALGDAAKGRIVLFNRRMDASRVDTFEAYGGAVNQRVEGAIEAAKVGAVAALVRSMTTRIDDFPHTGAMRYAEGVTKIPTAAISTAGADLLAALVKRGQPVRLALALDCETRADVTSHNVIGEIRGASLPDEIVLVGGHLDAWDVGQGAHDDGAGVVQTIEALRLVRALGLRPKRTLRAVLFMNEENGLRGGRAYRDAHKAEVERHVLAIESDRGGFAPRGFATNANPRAFEILRGITDLLHAGSTATLVQGGGGADISPLEREGVIVMEYLPDAQRYFDYHHCERDTLDAVHPRELELGAAWIAAMVYSVADLDERLPRNGSGTR